jgi:large subunit ribosomal protein L6
MTGKKQPRKEEKQVLIEVELPQGVSASLNGSVLTIKGSKGEVSRKLELRKVLAKVEGNKVVISTKRNTQKDKMMANSVEAHAKAMIKGVQEPYAYTLKICSGHFPITVAVKGEKLEVKNFLGEKVPRILGIKKGAQVKVEGDKILVESVSKEIAGQVSSDIEQLVRRPGFDTRIFQDGIYIIDKAGKGIK